MNKGMEILIKNFISWHWFDLIDWIDRWWSPRTGLRSVLISQSKF